MSMISHEPIILREKIQKHNSPLVKNVFLFVLYDLLLRSWKYLETDGEHNVQGRFASLFWFLLEPALLWSLGNSFFLCSYYFRSCPQEEKEKNRKTQLLLLVFSEKWFCCRKEKQSLNKKLISTTVYFWTFIVRGKKLKTIKINSKKKLKKKERNK